MSDLTQILADAATGDEQAASRLLQQVYAELKAMAGQKMAREKPGHTLNATALVHEAYLRLVDGDAATEWTNRGHFFSAAAEAMRRILVDSARKKSRIRHGGNRSREGLTGNEVSTSADPNEILAVHEALDRLAGEDSEGAEIIKLRYFAGLSVEEAAEALGLSRAAAYRHWKFARAWLQCELSDEP